MSDDTEFVSQLWVYVGRAKITGGKLGSAWLPVMEYEGDGRGKLAADTIAYGEKKRTRRVIGGVYRIETKPDQSSARLSTAAYVEPWADRNAVMQWEAAENAVAVAEESKRVAKNVTPEMLRALEPIRKQYGKTMSGVRRMAIELQVLAYLRSQRAVEPEE